MHQMDQRPLPVTQAHTALNVSGPCPRGETALTSCCCPSAGPWPPLAFIPEHVLSAHCMQSSALGAEGTGMHLEEADRQHLSVGPKSPPCDAQGAPDSSGTAASDRARTCRGSQGPLPPSA